MSKEIKTVDPQQATKLLQEGWFALDVRTQKERAESHIEGSIYITLTELSARASELDQAKNYLVYCHKGSRAEMAAQALDGSGFKVQTLKGGMQAWLAAELPITTADS